MLDIQGGAFTLLNGDATLTAQLETYQSAPAILTDPVPDDFEVSGVDPVVIIATPYSNEDQDDFTTNHRRVAFNVRIYNRPNGSTLLLDTVAERVRTVLRSWPGTAITGGVVRSCRVTGPISAPVSNPVFEGRIVTANTFIQET